AGGPRRTEGIVFDTGYEAGRQRGALFGSDQENLSDFGVFAEFPEYRKYGAPGYSFVCALRGEIKNSSFRHVSTLNSRVTILRPLAYGKNLFLRSVLFPAYYPDCALTHLGQGGMTRRQ